jgi:hypothetical protein
MKDPTKNIFIIPPLLMIFLFSCEKSYDPIKESTMLQVIIIEDLEEFEIDSIHIDSFSINKMRVDESEDIVTFEVSYGGGCGEHQFQLYSTEGVLYSNPPGCLVYLSHDANGDYCEALITETISFSLRPFHNKSYDALILHIHGYNGENFGTIHYKI